MTNYYMESNKVLIVAPSLDPSQNVSGVSAVTNFIIANNKEYQYEHFLQGRSDGESGTLNMLIRIWKNYWGWKKLLKRKDYKIIHYNFPLDALSILRDSFFLRAAHDAGKKIVIHVHGGLYLFKKNKPYIIKCILSGIFSWGCPIIVLSRKERERVRQDYHAENVYVLPNCVDLSEAERFTRNFGSDRLEMLYLGRIEPNKGMDYLYDAMAGWQTCHANFRVHFAGVEQGNHGYIVKFQRLLGDKFVYEGVVTGKEKVDLFKQCQIFLLPSFYEGLPIALLECMSFGMVPVVTDVGSMGEFVKDKENGLLLQVKDVKSIVDALNLLSHDHTLLMRLSSSARQTIFACFQPKNYISQLNSVYSKVGNVEDGCLYGNEN